jgi:transcriptional regulator with XRE-family HTH domain
MLLPVDANDINMIIGKNLRRIRKTRGWTQEFLAVKIGVTTILINQIENAKKGMGKDVMARVCNILQVHPWEFYLADDTPIMRDDERKFVEVMRKARPLNLSENIAQYARYLIDHAKKVHPMGEKTQNIDEKRQKALELYEEAEKRGLATLLDDYARELLARSATKEKKKIKIS